jgi:transcriptional regulator with XRE-family HTH domain
MAITPQLLKIRYKILGLLLIDARNKSQKGLKECASAMGVSIAHLKSYESGALAPTLPELEAYAYFLDLPISHFLGEKLLVEESDDSPTSIDQFIEIRQRLIGTAFRLARSEAKLTYKRISELTSISASKMKRYETGEYPIPLPELELLSRILNVPIESLMAQSGKVGNWRKKMLRSEFFFQMPEQLQEFACKPVNKPFLELAEKLSSLPADKLRAVAEGLLEITY